MLTSIPRTPRLRRYAVFVAATLGFFIPAAAKAQEAEPAASPSEPEAAAPAQPVTATPAAPRRRTKPLQVTVGTPPSTQDLGSEADMAGQIGPGQDLAAVLEQWAFTMKGSVRVPLRVGFGPRNDGRPGTEMHSLPRIVGLGSGDWNYVALAPNASAGITFTAGNPIASGTVIFSASHLIDPAYRVLDDTGLDSAYLTLKFPDAFGTRGGIAMLAGIFSERFGMSGPWQKSSGHYSTYLFGRTHQAGESITFNVDATEDLELIAEHGIGAKNEVVPFRVGSVELQGQDYIAGSSAQPYGSSFVHHSHAALIYDNWLRVGGHYMMAWSPDDNTRSLTPVPMSRMVVTGGDVHADSENINLYLGYSHVDGENLFPLSDVLQVLHSGTGRAFKLNYFGQKTRAPNDDPRLPGGLTPTNVSGTLDTVLWESLVKIAPLLGDPFGGRDLNASFYGMFNYARSPIEESFDRTEFDIKTYKLKLGLDVEMRLFRFMSAAARVDRVIPKLGIAAKDDDSYTAISPRVTFFTKPGKEQVILQYTHFFLGPKTVPGSPYTDGYYKADPDMLVLTGRMSF
jgi:hypothetical protein